MKACCGGTSMGSFQQSGRSVFAPIMSPATKFSQQLKFNFPRPCRSLFLERSLVSQRRASPVSVPNVEMSSKRDLFFSFYHVKETVCFDYDYLFCLLFRQ